MAAVNFPSTTEEGKKHFKGKHTIRSMEQP